MKIIESFTGFQPLEEVWIGGTYPTTFYSHLPNKIEDTFCYITEITQKSLDSLEKKLTQLGITVQKPIFEDAQFYMDDFDNLIKPPVSPRDWAITLGRTLLITPQGYKKEPFSREIDRYKSNGEDVQILDRSSDPRAWLDFPSVVRVGNKLIIDTSMTKDNKQATKKINESIELLKKDYQIEIVDTGGHADGVFCPIKRGHIFSSHYGDTNIYKKTFPGWNIDWLADTSAQSNGINVINNIIDDKRTWWIPENNFYSPVFSEHIEKKAADWVGNSKETIFEVNMLVVDEKNIICMAEDDSALKSMEKIGITAHIIDFPCRGFWDGGIDCITVDIRRSGGCLNYFNA